MNKKYTKMLISLLLCILMILFASCQSQEKNQNQNQASKETAAPEIEGLTYSHSMELDYAKCFDVYYYEDGYKVVDVHDDTQYLLVPSGKDAPEGVDDGMTVIEGPVENIYLAATSAMSLFDAMDGLDCIKMTSLKSSSWTVAAAAKAMENGKILFAGKYNEPDYEMILEEDCGLAIESTMIYHAPEVKEMIEELGIPVFVDRSSYESEPLGRTEWIKLYGALTDKEEAAEAFFAEQKESVSALADFENTGKTVAFFYVTTDGKVVVRGSEDYIPSMIEMAGGSYVFSDLSEETEGTSVSMTMESFYDKARDADYLIYNASIDSTVKTTEDLIAKDEIFKEFKAVKEGNLYSTGNSLYQRTDVLGNVILDFHRILTGADDAELEFMSKME